MGLIFVLHVIGIGILLNRLPIRFVTVLAAFIYFGIFYLSVGQYFTSHRQVFTPEMQLEDDYYRNPKRESMSPFAAPYYPTRPKEDEEAILEQERLMRQRRKQEQLQPSTNP
jgi:Na+/H+ antiporter NhaC